jgi:hypothetical protein
MLVAAGRCSQALIVCTSTKRHEQIWTGIRAITLNMYSEGLRSNEEFRSELSITVGSKGYHTEKFVDGPYPWNK